VPFLFSVVSGLEVTGRIENGGLMPGKNSRSDCLDHFNHSTENSGEPRMSDQKKFAKKWLLILKISHCLAAGNLPRTKTNQRMKLSGKISRKISRNYLDIRRAGDF
jgi:hypothetical protein